MSQASKVSGGMLLAALFLLSAPPPVQGEVLGEAICGSLENPYGPYDYRTDKHKLAVVERHHFNRDVESLRAGITTSKVGGDISYTLRAFPNHHRALHAVARLAVKEKKARPAGSKYSIDCWFDRAMRFSPDDGMVPLTYGIYLFQIGKKEKSLKMLEAAEKLGENSGNFHYNAGLIYADLKKYDRALEHAHAAYAKGFNLPGLRGKLEKAGKWQDPAPRKQN